MFLCIDNSKNYIIDIRNNKKEIMSNLHKTVRNNNITDLYKQTIEEWDYDKNYPLRPECFKKGSSLEVWWKSQDGSNSYESICSRIKKYK